MTKQPKSCCMHRRGFFQRGFFGTVAAGLALEDGPAFSKSFKASKKVAGYIERDHPESQMCLQCHFYVSPFSCTLVEGPVSPWGWCNYYAD